MKQMELEFPSHAVCQLVVYLIDNHDKTQKAEREKVVNLQHGRGCIGNSIIYASCPGLD